MGPLMEQYYPSINESCNNLNEVSGKICVPNKTKDINLNVFNLITRITESKTLTTHTSCKCKCQFDGKKCNSYQIWNNYKCRCECKSPRKIMCEEGYIWNPATCSCENGRCAKSVIDDSVLMDDENYSNEKYYNKFHEKKVIYNTKYFYILLAFLWITITLLIAVSIYIFFKLSSKQKTFVIISQYQH